MIEINNLTSFDIDQKLFSTVAKKVLSGENKGTESISLAFVSKQEIKKLNKKFRKKGSPTDVLSFELNDKENLGEIVVCPKVVKENSEKDEINFKEELVKVFIHGILHLLGYDHEKSEKDFKIMEKKQQKYLSQHFK